MWSSLIPKAPEGIGVDEFFTRFVPDQFSQMHAILGAVDLSFLAGKDFKMQFDIEGRVYSVTFKDGKDLEVSKGAIDSPAITVMISEKDWRDVVTGAFNELADGFTGDPTEFINVKRYEALLSIRGAVTMNLRKNDGGVLPLKIVFNGEEEPAATVNLDMVDALELMNKTTNGLALFMKGKLKFTGNMLLLMKLQTLV